MAPAKGYIYNDVHDIYGWDFDQSDLPLAYEYMDANGRIVAIHINGEVFYQGKSV